MSNDLSDNYKLALEVSIKFCGYRERSVKEVENKLIDKRFNRDVVRLALQKIKDLGFPILSQVVAHQIPISSPNI